MIRQKTYISQLESQVNALDTSAKRARVEMEKEAENLRHETEVNVEKFGTENCDLCNELLLSKTCTIHSVQEVPLQRDPPANHCQLVNLSRGVCTIQTLGG